MRRRASRVLSTVVTLVATSIVAMSALGASCLGGSVELPPDGGLPEVVVPPLPELPALPPIDLSGLPLPRSDTGNLVLIEVAHSRIEIDPTANDAITAVGTCTDLVTYCFALRGRTLAQCVALTPSCLTDQPWTEPEPCCPSTCRAAYSDAVGAGEDQVAAFERVFFRAPDCFPGVRALLGAP